MSPNPWFNMNECKMSWQKRKHSEVAPAILQEYSHRGLNLSDDSANGKERQRFERHDEESIRLND